MRKSYPSYSLLTLAGLFLAGSCSIIAEVDRTKIKQKGAPTSGEGGQATGGSATGGVSGTGASGASGTGTGGSNTGGTGGDAGGGTGGDAGGGAGGEDMGGAGMGGAGGEGGVSGPECGDGRIDTPEACDDGDMPPAGNDGCSATCTVEPGWDCPGTPSVCIALACGDGIRAGAEACDDGNNNACGTCSGNAGATVAGCSTSKPVAPATGLISPGAATDLVDGDYFTLNDGGHPPVEFEFDLTPGNGATRAGAVAIVFDAAGTATELQTAIVTAINAQGATILAITASNGTAPNVVLTNQVPGARGNQTSGENVTAPAFTVTDMTGGAARNCANGVGCRVPADCSSNNCNANSCSP